MTEAAPDLAHASVLLDLKRYDQAASLLARIVAAEPQDSRAWCLFAATHLGTGRYKEAAAAASSAITLAPLDDWPYRLASIAQRHLGKITAAISLATEACRLAPHEWRAYICLAQALLATQTDYLAQLEHTYEEYCRAAEQAAATALRLAPHEPDAHFTAGQVSYAQKKWKAARAHQEQALALDPAHSRALNELGRISMHRGGSPQAARHFLQAAQSAPGVSTYGRNAELPVKRVLARTTLAVYLASGALLIALETPCRGGQVFCGTRWPSCSSGGTGRYGCGGCRRTRACCSGPAGWGWPSPRFFTPYRPTRTRQDLPCTSAGDPHPEPGLLAGPLAPVASGSPRSSPGTPPCRSGSIEVWIVQIPKLIRRAYYARIRHESRLLWPGGAGPWMTPPGSGPRR